MPRDFLTKARLPLQIGFVLLLMAFLSRAVYLRWEDVRAIQATLDAGWICAGAAITAVFTLCLSLNWQWLLRRVSPVTMALPSLGLHRAFLTSFLTRYLPAGAFVNIGGKVELLKRQGGSRAAGLESVLYEIVFMVGGGLFLGWVAFTAYPASELLGQWQSLYPFLMAAAAVGWILCFSVPDRVLLWGRSLIRREMPVFTSARLTWSDRAAAFVLYTVANLLQGIAVLCLLLAVYPGMVADPGVMLHVVAAYPIGRLVGQATPFAPGGIGVREAAFTFLVVPWLPVEPVVISATLMRLISVLVEIAAALLVIGLDRRAAQRRPVREDLRSGADPPG